MPTPEKEARVVALKDSINGVAGLYLSEFSGISAGEMNDLRGVIYEAGGRLEIAKNRLLKIALAGTDGEALSEYLAGPTAVTFCDDDPISAAKAMSKFAGALDPAKKHWQIKAAFVDGRVFDTTGAQALAALPPLDEIKGSVVGAIAGPTNTLVHTLNAALSDLVFTLQAVAEKREAEGV